MASPVRPHKAVPLTKVGPPRKVPRSKSVAPPSVYAPQDASHRQGNAVTHGSPPNLKPEVASRGAIKKAPPTGIPDGPLKIQAPPPGSKAPDSFTSSQVDANHDVLDRAKAAVPPSASHGPESGSTHQWPCELLPDKWDPVDEVLPLGWVPVPVRCRRCAAHNVVCRVNFATAAMCAKCNKEHKDCTLVAGGTSLSGRRLPINHRIYLLLQWCLTANKDSVHPKEEAVPVDTLLKTELPAWFEVARQRCQEDYEVYNMKAAHDGGTTAEHPPKRNRPILPTPADEHGPRPIQIDSRPFTKRRRSSTNEVGDEEGGDGDGDRDEDEDEDEETDTARIKAKRQRTAHRIELKNKSASGLKSSFVKVDGDEPRGRISAKTPRKQRTKQMQVEEILASVDEDEDESHEVNLSTHGDLANDRKAAKQPTADEEGHQVDSTLVTPRSQHASARIPWMARALSFPALSAKRPKPQVSTDPRLPEERHLPESPRLLDDLQVPEEQVQVPRHTSTTGDLDDVRSLHFVLPVSAVSDHDSKIDGSDRVHPHPAVEIQDHWLSGIPPGLFSSPIEYRPVDADSDGPAIAATLNWNFDQLRTHNSQMLDAMSKIGQRGTQLDTRVANLNRAESGYGTLSMSLLQHAAHAQHLAYLMSGAEIARLRQLLDSLEADLIKRDGDRFLNAAPLPTPPSSGSPNGDSVHRGIPGSALLEEP